MDDNTGSISRSPSEPPTPSSLTEVHSAPDLNVREPSPDQLRDQKKLHGPPDGKESDQLPDKEKVDEKVDEKVEELKYGDDDWIHDPLNARNWSSRKKWTTTAIVRPLNAN